ncbi:acriflavin resistance protein [Vitreoscilla sp. C1]|uniref:efflux RND transporter permease subunit n=1 Tax=Vitreoscilla sp. (strain C1) TaxID=96942 RepID=UPI00148ED14E|nr:efflux RND transporter permease subunit [Vitreoscilla sp. C1]QJQ52195.1 acriflavin resistance protein [Vitreoscilla sp. C1]
MSKFFIDRPIFAWVVSIFIVLAGLLGIRSLPVEQYPQVTPPTIQLSVAYAGADAQTLQDSVLSIIERQMNGLEGMDYMESSATSNGTGSLTITFKPGIDEDIAQVNVQNRLAQAESRLPEAVKQVGVTVSKSTSNFLMFLMLYDESGKTPVSDTLDYIARNVQPELQRIEGVGNVQVFGSERAMRVWIDPAKLQGLNLSINEVNAAIRSQNAQVAPGTLGDKPSGNNQTISATITVPGQLSTVEAFENIVLRANSNGSTVRLKDVAKVELGQQDYSTEARLNGKPAAGIGIQLSPSGNAVATSDAIRAKMDELAPFFPEGVQWKVPYDSSLFVGISIEKVIHTLIEAMILVFIVMFIFLQNIRYTLIPTLVVPIALLGAFAIMQYAGMSINVLSMFAMVLVIGIVVDDAIVVVENVERIMAEEHLSPLDATKKAMGQIQGAVVGITVVLVSVFIPMAFFTGITGNIYRQFSLVMAVSIVFSAFLALSLTPALCATLLKPVDPDHHVKKGFFGKFFNWFNQKFDINAKRYEGFVGKLLRRSGRMLVIYAALIGVSLFVLARIPTGFLPTEDQGVALSIIQLPPGATTDRTMETVKTYENFVMNLPEVAETVTVAGFSFAGQGQNMGMSFLTLTDWSERSAPGQDANSIAGKITGTMMQQVKDGVVIALTLPAIPALGTGNGFSFRLQDRGSHGHLALVEARNKLLMAARQSPVFNPQSLRAEGLEDAPQLRIDIDRDAANAQGVPFANINAALSTAIGSTYANDFPNQGRMQRVVVQAKPDSRMQPEDILAISVINNQGVAVPLSTFATANWISGAMQVVQYNGYPAMKITGEPAVGYSTGEAMAEMERLASDLGTGFGYEWTGASKEEKAAGNQAVYLYAFSILAIFLCLAALYESWSIPLAVILVVPLGLLGTVLGVWGRGMTSASSIYSFNNDVYFQVALITVIGLSAKNAILIIEFAKDLQAQGKSAAQAALAAAHLRFRPILMTSFAFILGVVPLFFASGASSASQRAIGTGVFWGMTIGTVLSVLFVPVFYLVVRSLFKQSSRQQERDMAHANAAGVDQEMCDHYVNKVEASLSEEDRNALKQEIKTELWAEYRKNKAKENEDKHD